MPVDEGKLRDALRPVFDKFDVDGSGSVSTDEMTRMVKQLKMDLSPEKIRKMMVEADPDMSGEVDFEEFCSAVKSQVEAGNGGALAELVQSAGGFFGFFGNLFSFMGGGAAEEPAKPAAPTPKGGGGGGGGGSAVPSARAMSAAPAPPPPAASSFFSSDPVVEASSPPQGGGLGSSLFDKYMSPSEARANRRLGHNETRTTRLRATGVKLSVYLNTEVNRGYATVISLPEECDTLGEVMPMIQKSMQLDRRMLYAAELYLPDGKKIMSYKELIDAAALDTAIVVGCGEPFDPSSIPYDILEFHLQGGGRQAANKVKKQLQSKRKDEALEKADTVRASGHGLDSRAAITSREQHQEDNREQANMQRQEYMEQLMYRAAQNKSLMDRVHHNNLLHKMEQDEARAKREEFERVRLETLADQRRMDKELADARKAQAQMQIKNMHDKVKNDFESSTFYKKSKKLANIARSGSTKGVKI